MHLGDRCRQISVDSRPDDLLISKVNSRTANAVQGNPVSKNQETNKLPPPPSKKKKKNTMQTQNVKES